MADLKRILRPERWLDLKLLLGLLICLPMLVAPLPAATLAVLYPEAPPPYKQVFDQIVDGIDERHADRLIRYPLETRYNREQVLSQLDRDQVDMVITLGRRGYSLINDINGHYPFVSGALPLTPNGTLSGVSLITDPDNLLSQLKVLSPATKRVFVLYTTKSRWMVELAKVSAKKKGLELWAYEVDTLSDAVRKYEEILGGARHGTDAIWLPLDKVTANETVILPMLLREAWDRRLVMFSSKPSHVKRGSLFSIYPNNQQSGVRLAEMVKELFSGKAVPGVEPSRSLNLGVNLRTAVHLGLEYSPALTRSFYRTFPQP